MMQVRSIAQDELDKQLAELGAKLSVHEVHALYLGALTSTSLRLGPQRLLPFIFGDEMVLGESLDEANRVFGVLFGYWNTLSSECQAGRVRFAAGGPTPKKPLCSEDLLRFAQRRTDELRWYVRGIDAGGDDPIEWGDEGRATLEKLAEASAFFEAYAATLARPDAVEQGALDETGRLLSETSTICEHLMADLMAVTARVRLEALETSSAMEGRQTDDGVKVGAPLRRVGRNERCPCGSGKKWKQCCGKPSRLN
jgi:hypothetical protein